VSRRDNETYDDGIETTIKEKESTTPEVRFELAHSSVLVGGSFGLFLLDVM
jgi:hypothetical protein